MSNFERVHHPILRHTYLLLEDKTKYCYRIIALKGQLHNLTRLEILKLSNDDRPTSYRHYVDRDSVLDKDISKFHWKDTLVPTVRNKQSLGRLITTLSGKRSQSDP
jgi:hypothetical protein